MFVQIGLDGGSIMKVLLINGSPRKDGCTFTALSEIRKELRHQEIESELVQIGTKGIHGCIGCGSCRKNYKCVYEDDIVNDCVERMQKAEGLIVGSPVYYASANGSVISLLDRMFYIGGGSFAGKPAAAIASARRAGTTFTIDELNKYFTIAQMPVVSSTYWNMVHGNCREEVLKDEEGLQTMRNLAKNMAWLMQCIQCGKEHGIALPEAEKEYRTNFIR